MLIMVPQKCLYQPKSGSVSKDRPLKSETSHVYQCQKNHLETPMYQYEKMRIKNMHSKKIDVPIQPTLKGLRIGGPAQCLEKFKKTT